MYPQITPKKNKWNYYLFTNCVSIHEDNFSCEPSVYNLYTLYRFILTNVINKRKYKKQSWESADYTPTHIELKFINN